MTDGDETSEPAEEFNSEPAPKRDALHRFRHEGELEEGGGGVGASVGRRNSRGAAVLMEGGSNVDAVLMKGGSTVNAGRSGAHCV